MLSASRGARLCDCLPRRRPNFPPRFWWFVAAALVCSCVWVVWAFQLFVPLARGPVRPIPPPPTGHDRPAGDAARDGAPLSAADGAVHRELSRLPGVHQPPPRSDEFGGPLPPGAGPPRSVAEALQQLHDLNDHDGATPHRIAAPPPPLAAANTPGGGAATSLQALHRQFAPSAAAGAPVAPVPVRTLYVVLQSGSTNELFRYLYSAYFRCFVDAHAFRIVRIESEYDVTTPRNAATAAAAAPGDTAPVVEPWPYRNVLVLAEWGQFGAELIGRIRRAASESVGGGVVSVGVLHTGDEMHAQQTRDAYRSADYVLRLYYDAQLHAEHGAGKVVWLPNGWSVREFPPDAWDGKTWPTPLSDNRDECDDQYFAANPIIPAAANTAKSGAGNASVSVSGSLARASDRSIVFNLVAATLHAGRSITLRAFVQPAADPHRTLQRLTRAADSTGRRLVVVTDGSMGHEPYQRALHASAFTAVPCGNNPETFRLWEALQADSIPIVERCADHGRPDHHYLTPLLRDNNGCRDVLAPNPLLTVTNWSTDLVAVLSPYIPALAVDDTADGHAGPAPTAAEVAGANARLNALQMRTALWWEQYKRCIRGRVVEVINKHWVE